MPTEKPWMLAVGVVAFALCAGCGGQGSQANFNGSDARADGARGADAARDAGRPDVREASTRDVYPAPHSLLPIVENSGGPVLAHPRVVPVFWEGDPLMAQTVQFLEKLTTASYWAGATSEYGVGPLTVTAPVFAPGPPPATMTDADVKALVRAHLNGEVPDAGPDGGDAGGPWPMPATDTIYAVLLSESTTFTLGGLISCQDFAGYHLEVTYAGGTTSYALLPRCASFPLLPGKGALDILTVALSHELAEGSTDPFPFTNPAYYHTDTDGTGWSEVTVGGEIGDLCALDLSSFVRPADVGFLVQRVWSNARARASEDTCAPAPPGENYFSAVPDLSMTEMNPGVYVEGITVPPGGSAVTSLHLFSDRPTSGPWKVTVTEAGEEGTRIPPDPMHQLSLSLDRDTGQNGDVLTLTLRRKPLAKGEKASGLAFRIVSTLGSQEYSYWGIAGY